MSGPVSRVDPALAAALDRYAVPVATAGFADRIAAAAMTRGQGNSRQPDAPPRDRRGPWRRRAFVGGVAALLLGTAAAAAGLLERVGIHVPAAVALLSPPAAHAPPPKLVHHHHARPAAAPPSVSPAPVAVAAAVEAPPALSPAPPVILPRPARPRVALIRARLAAMPPAERRVAVRALVRRAETRAALRREMVAVGGETPPAPVRAEQWLRARPARREALIDRAATMRANAATHRSGDEPLPSIAPATPAQALPPDARAGPTVGSPRRDWAARFERRRALREMRLGHAGWRRFRRP